MPQKKEYRNLKEFLTLHLISSADKDKTITTHTRIPSSKQGKHQGAGAYSISEDELDTFYDLYYDTVIIQREKEHLTEKQLDTEGPILLDFDFRYAADVKKRLFTQEHVDAIVGEYADKLQEIFVFNDKDQFPIYVFEKPKVNPQEKFTKDGIHILIGLQADRILQRILRRHILEDIGEVVVDLTQELKNTWDDVLDEGISKGHTNWQMYGSCKPDNDKYCLVYKYNCTFNSDEDNLDIHMEDADVVKKFITKDNFPKMSAQYKGNLRLEKNPDIQSEYETFEKDEERRKKNKSKKTKRKIIKSSSGNNLARRVDYSEIKDMDELNSAISETFYAEDMKADSHQLNTIHEITCALSSKYFNPYDKWRLIGTALHDFGNDALFLTWMKFSSKSNKFDFDDLPGYYSQWCEDFKEGAGVSVATIYWCLKEENYDEYQKIHSNSLDYWINLTINGERIGGSDDKRIQRDTDYDIAVLMKKCYDDQYVCTGIKNNEWYMFQNHCWTTTECGTSFRKELSVTLPGLLAKKISQLIHSGNEDTESSGITQSDSAIVEKITQLVERLKKSVSKDAILKESKEVFYNKDFHNKLDSNPYLLGCKNGVVDFKNKTFRKGRPDDYISLSTNIVYNKLDKKTMSKEIKEITEFMEQLFPIKELREYMWEHLASTLIGKNDNQTFNIYTGSGSNGKSKMVELMSLVLGDYKGIVPISLITQNRSKAGGTSTEIVQLKGKRYAVMQEPSKGDKINEGIMKELTGGDPITGRGLYRNEMTTYIPQFKLAVCTNTLFDVKSNDDGTWRRIRVCDFKSKFTNDPVQDDPDKPYQFKIDKGIDNKFEKWAPVMLSMLVDIAFKTQGIVTDRDIVMESSNQYRSGQDYLTAFVSQNIKKKEGERIKKTELAEQFRQWYSNEYGQRPPKLQELHDFMTKRFGRYRHGKGWSDVKIIYEDDSDSDEEDNGNTQPSEGTGEGNQLTVEH